MNSSILLEIVHVCLPNLLKLVYNLHFHTLASKLSGSRVFIVFLIDKESDKMLLTTLWLRIVLGTVPAHWCNNETWENIRHCLLYRGGRLLYAGWWQGIVRLSLYPIAFLWAFTRGKIFPAWLDSDHRFLFITIIGPCEEWISHDNGDPFVKPI